MSLPGFVRDAIRAVVALALAHQYLLLFVIVAIEEAGVPLPAPSDVVIAAYGYRARDDLGALATIVLVCAAASTAGTLVPYALTYRFGDRVAHRLAGLFDISPLTIDRWEVRVRRGGFLAVFIGRLVPGARVAMSLLAGTSRSDLRLLAGRLRRGRGLLVALGRDRRRARADVPADRRAVHRLFAVRGADRRHRLSGLPIPSGASAKSLRYQR